MGQERLERVEQLARAGATPVTGSRGESTACRSAAPLRCSNGSLPATSQNRVTPTAQMSARWSMPTPVHCSGAMYRRVPIGPSLPIVT